MKTLRILLAALWLAACSDDPQGGHDAGVEHDASSGHDAAVGEDGGPGEDAGPGEDGGAECDVPDSPVPASFGGVVVTYPNDGVATSATAVAWFPEGGALPFHDETMREGDCRLLQYEPGFCDPPCFTGACIDGSCRDYPDNLEAGSLQIEGTASDVTLDDYAGTYIGSVAAANLTPGASLTARASGDEVPAFSIAAAVPERLEAEITNGEIFLQDGQDLVLRWTPPSSCGTRIHVALNSRTAAHGLPPTTILECDAPDTGSLTIPQALVEAFPESTRTKICVLVDCPASHLTRYTSARTPLEGGDVSLRIEDDLPLWVHHNDEE